MKNNKKMLSKNTLFPIFKNIKNRKQKIVT